MALLESSGRQTILLKCLGVAAVGFGLASLLPMLLRHVSVIAAYAVFTLGAALLVGGIVYAIRRVSCPLCQLRWLEYAWGQVPLSRSSDWLMSFEQCPGCINPKVLNGQPPWYRGVD
jgi:uncharacterized membrane protein HdeD (DUF308 family)